MFVVFAQRFFANFLRRPKPDPATGECAGMGGRFFEGLINGRYFAALQAKVEAVEVHWREEEPDDEANRSRIALLKTFSKWLSDPLVMDRNLHVASLSSLYMPHKVAGLLEGSKVRAASEDEADFAAILNF